MASIPLPNYSVNISDDSWNIAYQWEISESILNQIQIDSKWIDPQTWEYYNYFLSEDNLSKEEKIAFRIFINKKINEEVELYEYNNFSEGIQSVDAIMNQRPVLIIGSKDKKFFTSYYAPNNNKLSLLNEDKFPNNITDNKGNIYNIFGYAVSGPDAGTQLESPVAYVAQNWAWKDFFVNLKIND